MIDNSCSDGGLNGTLELHVEDSCALYSNGTINDFNVTAYARSSGTVTYVCEQDVQCARGWTRYVDDGAEGHDSCLQFTQIDTIMSQAIFWSAVVELNPPGSHAITIGASSMSPNSSMSVTLSQISSSAPLSSFGPPVQNYGVVLVWAGIAQLAGDPGASTGWYWIDGTPAGNLNCGLTGCGVWSTTASPVST